MFAQIHVISLPLEPSESRAQYLITSDEKGKLFFNFYLFNRKECTRNVIIPFTRNKSQASHNWMNCVLVLVPYYWSPNYLFPATSYENDPGKVTRPPEWPEICDRRSQKDNVECFNFDWVGVCLTFARCSSQYSSDHVIGFDWLASFMYSSTMIRKSFSASPLLNLGAINPVRGRVVPMRTRGEIST